MANRIRTGDPRGFNKGRSSKFRDDSRVRQTPEERRGTYRPKRCGNNDKYEDNSPKTLNDEKQLRNLNSKVIHFSSPPPKKKTYWLLLKSEKRGNVPDIAKEENNRKIF